MFWFSSEWHLSLWRVLNVIMRYYINIFFSVFLLSFLLISCQQQEEAFSSEVAVRMNVEMKEYGSFIYVTENYIWKQNDKISLFEASAGSSNVASPLSSGAAKALFTSSLSLPEDDNTVIGLYPHDAKVKVAEGNLTFEIPQLQNGSLISLQAGKTKAARKAYQASVLKLEPLYKVLNVWVDRRNSEICSIKVKASDGSPIAGQVSLDVDSWSQSAKATTVSVTLENPLDCSGGGVSIPVMVADTDLSGYIAEVTDKNGEVFTADMVTEGIYSNQKSYELGISQALFGSLSKSEAASMPSAGVKHMEVTMNTFWRGYTMEECYQRARSTKSIIDATKDLQVWSVHLPFSKELDISLTDDAARSENAAILTEMIRLAGEFGPKKLVLHPSSEPIADSDRAQRLRCAKESIGKLLPVAKEIGAQLCIENLPRTCLGRTSDEMRYLIEDYPEVMVCFDSNHLLIEDHASFFRNVGERIGTIHASDYDMSDERHWMPGQGIINWPIFLTSLMHYGYEGVFMTEVKGSYSAADVMNVYTNLICATK